MAGVLSRPGGGGTLRGMPHVHVYVSQADKEFLAAAPGEWVVARWLREEIHRRRSEAEACEHPDLEVYCPACHWRALAGRGDVEGMDLVEHQAQLSG